MKQCTGKVSSAAVDEVAWCSMLFAQISRCSWIRTRLLVNSTALKDALNVICDNSINTFNLCMTTAVATMTLIANIFEGSKDVQWSQCLVRSGAHRTAQAHITTCASKYTLVSRQFEITIAAGTATTPL